MLVPAPYQGNSLTAELNKVFSYVRLGWSIPNYFPKPELSDERTTAYISMNSQRIKISTEFVGKLSKHMDLDSIFKGLLAHEFGHWDYFPNSTDRSMRINRTLSNIVEGDPSITASKPVFIKHLSNYFADVYDNIHQISGGNSEILDIYDAMEKRGQTDLLLTAFYHKVFDRGIKYQDVIGNAEVQKILDGNDPWLSPKLDELQKLHWDNVMAWGVVLPEFYRIIKDVIDKDLNQQGNGQGDPDASDGTTTFDDLADDVFRERDEQEKKRKAKAKARGMKSSPKSISETLNNSVVDTYILAAEKYDIPLPVVEYGGTVGIKLGRTKWDLSDPISSIYHYADPTGECDPVFARKKRIVSSNVHIGQGKTPNLLIIIDSSGSMIDPDRSWSPAALGGIVAARSTIANGGSVEVVNFSSSTLKYEPTRDIREAARQITTYLGGGTVVDLGTIKDAEEEISHEGEYIELVVSDMEISNLDNVMTHFMDRENSVFIHITQSPMSDLPPNRYFPIGDPDDIISIVLDKIKPKRRGE